MNLEPTHSNDGESRLPQKKENNISRTPSTDFSEISHRMFYEEKASSYDNVLNLRKEVSSCIENALKLEENGEYDKAVLEYKKAIEPALQVNDKENLSLVILKICDCYEKNFDIPTAINFEEKNIGLLKIIHASSSILTMHYINLLRLYEVSSLNTIDNIEQGMLSIKKQDCIDSLKSCPKDLTKGFLFVKPSLSKLLEQYQIESEINPSNMDIHERALDVITACEKIFPNIDNIQKKFLTQQAVLLNLKIAEINGDTNYLNNFINQNKESPPSQTIICATSILLRLYLNEGQKESTRDLLLDQHEYLSNMLLDANTINGNSLQYFLNISKALVSFYCSTHDTIMADRYFKFLDTILQKPESIKTVGTNLSMIDASDDETIKKICNDSPDIVINYIVTKHNVLTGLKSQDIEDLNKFMYKIFTFIPKDILNEKFYADFSTELLNDAIYRKDETTATKIFFQCGELLFGNENPHICINFALAKANYLLTFACDKNSQEIYELFDSVENILSTNHINDYSVYYNFFTKKIVFLFKEDKPTEAWDLLKNAKDYFEKNGLQTTQEMLCLLKLELRIANHLGYTEYAETLNENIKDLEKRLQKRNEDL